MNDWINPFFESGDPVPLLRDVFPDWLEDDGIFDALDDIANLPWEGVVSSSTLNLEYFGNHSGAKFPAPLVMQLLSDDGTLTDTNRGKLASVIWSKFKEPWTRLWQTNVVDYDPTHNYDISEHRNLVREDESSDSGDSTGSETTTHGLVNTTDGSNYGFNTSDDAPKPVSKIVSTDSGTTSNSGQRNTDNTNASGRSEVEVTHKGGNVGTSSYQQMIESERRLWMWNFFEQVYKDIDSVLSLPIYDSCRV